MGLIKEPTGVDFIIQSTPWTEEQLKEFRAIMKKEKAVKLAREKRRTKRKETIKAGTSKGEKHS